MKQTTFRLLPLAAAAALALGGCAEQSTRPAQAPMASSPSAPASTPATRSTAPQPSAATRTAHPEASANETPIGVTACDDYLASYRGCHRAAGIYAPDSIEQHYQEMHDSLLEQSRDPAKREQLADRCSSLADSLKKALHGKACEPDPGTASSASTP